MIDDPIVEEIRACRQAHAARFNYDVAAIFADMLDREKKSTRPVVTRQPRRILKDRETEAQEQPA